MPVLGFDVSHWNGDIDFDVAYSAGIRFTLIRAGSINNITGVPYVDYRWEQNLQRVKACSKPMPFGTYWYFRPNKDPIVQGRYYGHLVNSCGSHLGHIANVEVNQNISPNQFADNLCIFRDYFERETDIESIEIAYTRQSFWDANIAGIPLWHTLLLWAARWVTMEDHTNLVSPWYDGKFKFRDWNDWMFWQFTGENNGLASRFGSTNGDPDMDLDYFNGNLEQLYAFAGLEPEPEHALTTLEYLNSIDVFLRDQGYTGVLPPLT